MRLFIAIATSLFLTLFAVQASYAESSSGVKALKSILKTTIDKSGNQTSRYELEFMVETEGARVLLTNYKTKFAGAKNDFKLLDVYSSNGEVKSSTSANDLVFSDVQTSNVGLSDMKQVNIPIRDVKVGSRVYISYQISTPSFDGTFSDGLSISNTGMAAEEYYTYESPLPLNFISFNFDEYFTAMKATVNGKFVVTVRPSEAAYKTDGKSSKSASFQISNAPNWLTLNSFYSAEYKKIWSAKLPPEFEAIVAKAKTLKTPKEQIEYASLQLGKLIAYSGKWVNTKGKFAPQTFAKLLKDKTGDCKDFSTSLAAMLQRLNFTAYPALTFRTPTFAGKEIVSKFATLPSSTPFNHAITWAKDSTGKTWWIDPTNPLVMADVISSDILGNFSLVLDATTPNVVFMPESNPMGDDAKFEQTIKLNADDTATASGHFSFNEVGYNHVGQYERMNGLETVKQFVNVLTSPGDKLAVEVQKKTNEAVPSYDFSYQNKKFVREEKERYKYIPMPHSVSLITKTLKKDAQSYVGEVGTFKSVTTIEKLSTIDTFEADCYARTPWVDADRQVLNKNGNIVITDTVVVKKRIITKQESQSEDFLAAVNPLLRCSQGDAIRLYINPKLKTVGTLEIEKKLGPPLDKMNDDDAYNLLTAGPDGIPTMALTKFIKYYDLKIQKNPKDLDAYGWKARGVMVLGSGDVKGYLPAYLEDALKITTEAVNNNKDKYQKTLFRNKIYANMRLGRYREAIADLKLYSNNEPDKFSTHIITADMAFSQEKYLVADQWLDASELYLKTPEDRAMYDKMRRSLSKVKIDYSGILSAREKAVASNPKNAQAQHDLALVYRKVGQIDKAIAAEMKVIALVNSPPDRVLISRLYGEKAANWYFKSRDQIQAQAKLASQPATGSRGPASVAPAAAAAKPAADLNPFDQPGFEDLENSIIQAGKWDPASPNAQVSAIYFYDHKRKIDSAKKREYESKFQQASATLKKLDPKNQVFAELEAEEKAAKAKKNSK